MPRKIKSQIITFQDFNASVNKRQFIIDAISSWKQTSMYRTARDADAYDAQRNTTINTYVQRIWTRTGNSAVDFTAANNKIASNLFHRLNTQRCMYSLGGGVTFVDPSGSDATDKSGIDTTKELLGGATFDHDLRTAAYDALIHGVSFCFWNRTRMHVFPVTEFVPLWDEYDGTLKAGIRFWRVDRECPMSVVLYELDGYTKFETTDETDTDLVMVEHKHAYITTTQWTDADEAPEVIGEQNYSSLPIVPMWGSRLRQSTLVGMKQAIDSYDLIRSGFANDLTDCAQIYWILENYGGMSDEDLDKFRDQLKLMHIANVNTGDDGKVTPYTQEVPYQARQTYLDAMRAGIYEDFGGLDVANISAAAKTATEINAAYQPLDENADDFEFQVAEAVQQLLTLLGIEDMPIFKRNRISNQLEQVQMVMLEAPYLDDATILSKLPNIAPEEVAGIIEARNAGTLSRFGVE
jgi:hypothetical protein